MNLTNHRSEADIQAEFYHQARLIGLECRLEVRLPCKLADYRSSQMRVDIVTIDADRTITALIEVKREGKVAGATWRQTRGYMAMSKAIGVPFYQLNEFAACGDLARKIAEGA